MPHLHVSDLPWQERCSPTGKFQSFSRNLSVALGGLRNVGTWGGGHPFDVQIRRVPAGKAVCPYHLHAAQWEFFVVLSGTANLRVGGEQVPVAAGEAFVHPPGEPHQLTNTGADPLDVLIVADNPQLDAFYYPDSNKWGLRPPNRFFRIEEVDYFAGEDAPPGGFGPSPNQPTLSPAPRTPFSSRRCSIAALPWDKWSSPKGKFRGAAKELSIALGALRNTPTGLGGHPFEVELDRIAPGEAPNPFHSHAAQWEFYQIVQGTAKVRAGAELFELSAGGACVHPPGEPHQIRNASATEDLVYYLIADNPPADYWYYPDSKKWGLRSPRMFFRTSEVEYYDGEE